MSRPRRIATIWHRYVGLALAGFLTIVGLTGAMIAWNGELERVFAPALFVLPADRADGPVLDAFALRDAAALAVPGFAVEGLDFTREADAPALFYVEARPGGPAPPNDQIALDPVTGGIVGARKHGDLCQGLINLMPFLYDLHDTLALGDTGALVLGVVALFWTIDCFIGAWLTFPVRRVASGRAGARWLARWQPAWRVRRHAARFKLVFDLHRAGGLWLWAMLFIIAWSSVSFNLPQVYQPVMGAVFGLHAQDAPENATAAPPRLGWRDAHARAVAVMAVVARQQGFVVHGERLMYYDRASHSYAYRVRSSLDPGRTGNTQVSIDADSGRLLATRLPTGGATGTTITTWIGDLHTANVFGRPMQILLTITGLGTAMLSITGVLVWARKRSARQRTVHRRSPAAIRQELRPGVTS